LSAIAKQSYAFSPIAKVIARWNVLNSIVIQEKVIVTEKAQ
jgi:hypothetical protein